MFISSFLSLLLLRYMQTLVHMMLICSYEAYSDPLPVPDSLSDASIRSLSHSSSEDYDKHGCCLSCGEFYCPSSKKCISDWDDCNLGSYDSSTNICKFTFKNSRDSFSYELGSYALPRAAFYEITDTVSHPDEIYRYYFNLCKHVETRNLPSVCKETYGSASESCSDSSLAFQYSSINSVESCYRMSDCNRVYNTDKVRCCSFPFYENVLLTDLYCL
jgi:hypothetical protein